jgi:uncharacterized phiE125 gp8 family phage protein
MAAILLDAPALEPITLAEAKAYLRVDHDADDDMIATLTASARAEVEARTRRALITQRWRIMCDAWPADGRMAVTPAPVREVVAARVYDQDGVAHALDTEAFVVDAAAAPAVVAFVPWALAVPGRAVAGIELDLECGYGDTAADVPEPLRQAVRLLLAHAYENRSLDTVPQAPGRVAALIAPYRALSL